MPFRDAQTHFNDIIDAIALVDRFTDGLDFDAYDNDMKTQSAVERQLQIVTEAAYRLYKDGQQDQALCPGIDWKGFRDMGNILRHGYHKVDNQIVWNTVKDELPELKIAVKNALAQHFPTDDSCTS